jgi:flagellar basal body-associated protein FliL
VDKAKKKPNFILIIIAVLAIGVAVYTFYFRNAGESTPEGTVVISYAIKDSFVTNVKGSQKLFKATVVLGINDKKLSEYLDENLPVVRDTILFILRNLSEEDILKQGIQEELRVTISQALNEALQIDGITTVFFSDFVMQ